MNHNEELGKIVWQFIDRMRDCCEVDTAENILEDFTKACEPILSDRIDEIWKEKYGYTYTEFNQKRG